MNVFQCPLCFLEIRSRRPLSVVKRQHVAECAECRELVGEVLDSNAELLAACEAALAELHGYADAGQSNKADHLCDSLRTAIASAKGGAQ